MRSYLALGDSYTIGELVSENERWPHQLVEKLNQKGHKIAFPKTIAVTGWTTNDLLKAMKKELHPEDKFDLVSVLIGVNNQYQKKSLELYKKELRIILEKAISHCSRSEDGVFVLSIPDYSGTPLAKEKDKDWDISGEIEEYNSICEKICKEFELPFYDITPLSKKIEQNPEYITNDGLHLTGEMYSLWVDEIIEAVEKKLNH